MANDNAGILKNIFARDATITKIKPINKNLPMLLKSRAGEAAILARLKNVIPVPAAAIATICPPRHFS